MGVVGPDELADSIESAKNLKAKFEAMRFMADPDNKENGGAGGGALSKGRSPVPIRVNRFVVSTSIPLNSHPRSQSLEICSCSQALWLFTSDPVTRVTQVHGQVFPLRT